MPHRTQDPNGIWRFIAREVWRAYTETVHYFAVQFRLLPQVRPPSGFLTVGFTSAIGYPSVRIFCLQPGVWQVTVNLDKLTIRVLRHSVRGL